MVKQQQFWLFIAVYTLTFVFVSTLTRHADLVSMLLACISTTVTAFVYVIRGVTQRYDIFTWFLALVFGLLTVFFLRLFFIIAQLKAAGVI